MILNSVRETVAEPYFLSILQHLLSIRDDIYARSVAHTRTHTHTLCLTHSLTHSSSLPTKRVFLVFGWLVGGSKYEEVNRFCVWWWWIKIAARVNKIVQKITTTNVWACAHTHARMHAYTCTCACICMCTHKCISCTIKLILLYTKSLVLCSK